MKRILVMGGSGMLGHRMFHVLSRSHETYASFRENDPEDLVPQGFFSGFKTGRLELGVNAGVFGTVEDCLDRVKPQVVVNCIGMVKQRPGGTDPVTAIELNSLFPHRLAEACSRRGIWMVHIGTDCVFSGKRGNYTENDPPDARDLYGRSKALGEPVRGGCLTLRTSIIGRELKRTTGLLEWFLSNRGGSVKGYSSVIWSGVTTGALSGIVQSLVECHAGSEGMFHVASGPVSKYDLLRRINDSLDLGIEVVPVGEPAEDRSLCAAEFKRRFGIVIPGMDDMIASLAEDIFQYDEWRGWHVPFRR